MKRKIEEKLLDWKTKSNGKTALLIDGARRVGKSFIVEEFAKQNYSMCLPLLFCFRTKPPLPYLRFQGDH